MSSVKLLSLGALAALAAATPNTCQPRSQRPYMPIYHLIGNVTTNSDGAVTSVEAINDLSSVIHYKGIYHIFHQCCQNHWDHVVSTDLVHWTRLPPPVVPGMNPTGVKEANWYDAHGSWDGSLSIPNDWNGLTEPVIVMTAVPGPKPPAPSPAADPGPGASMDAESYTRTPPDYVPRGVRRSTNWMSGAGMSMQMAVVRPTNASDPFLLSWTKDPKNPIQYTSGAITSPYDTPGQVWKNGDHWNFLNMGVRYTTTDPTLHTWGAASGPWPRGENGGEWFSKLANLQDGSAPPADAPGWMVNVAGGNKYEFGNYDSTNESWTKAGNGGPAVIDHGPNDNWMVGQFVDKRFMNIGWSIGGPPMMVDDFPQRNESGFGFVRAPAPESGSSCQYTTKWEVFPATTNIYDRMPSPTNVTHGTLHFIGLFETADACFAAVKGFQNGPYHSFTWNDPTLKQPYGSHCWGDTSMTWQGRGAKGQVSGRGPGFPVVAPLPNPSFTHDHLTGLREVAYDPKIGTLVSNPVRELVTLRNGTLGSMKGVTVAPNTAHVVAGTGTPADASTSDVVVNVTVPASVSDSSGNGVGAAVGVSVLANVTSDGTPFGGILTTVNFTTSTDPDGNALAVATIQTLNPCGTGSSGVAQATFPILKGETKVDIRVLVDRSIIEVFIMGGRVVFTKAYNPGVFYLPDTAVALHAWGTPITASVDVFSMGCGWTEEPWQPHPTLESVSKF